MPKIKAPKNPERGGCDPTWEDEPAEMPDEQPIVVPVEEPIEVPNWPQPVKVPARSV